MDPKSPVMTGGAMLPPPNPPLFNTKLLVKSVESNSTVNIPLNSIGRLSSGVFFGMYIMIFRVEFGLYLDIASNILFILVRASGFSDILQPSIWKIVFKCPSTSI